MIKKILSTTVVLVSFFVVPIRLEGQLTPQYTAPGGALGESEGVRDQVESGYDQARWRLGALRVDPWVGVRDLSYLKRESSDGEEQVPAEWTGSAGAGLRFYLASGEHSLWSFHLLPEYRWFEKRTDASGVQGRYGLGFFGDFNRLSLELTARRQENLSFATLEDLRRADSQTDAYGLDSEFRLGSKFGLFLEYSQLQSRFDSLEGDEGFAVSALDRDEQLIRVGLRWHLRDSFSLGFGFTESETSFKESGRNRSNSGSGWSVDLLLEGARTRVEATVGQRDLKADDSLFIGYDELDWNLRLDYDLTSRFQIQTYASKTIAFSLDAANSHLERERLGAALRYQIGSRINVDLFAEQGTNELVGTVGGASREEDVDTWGVFMRVDLAEWMVLDLGYSLTEVGGTEGFPDRQLETLKVGLRFGRGRAEW